MRAKKAFEVVTILQFARHTKGNGMCAKIIVGFTFLNYFERFEISDTRVTPIRTEAEALRYKAFVVMYEKKAK
jgi:hypothetical protein